MRNGPARIREWQCDLNCGMEPQYLQMTSTDVHNATGRTGRNEAGDHGFRFGLNYGAFDQDPAFEDRDLFAAVVAVHGWRGAGWNRDRDRRERRSLHALASDSRSGLDTVVLCKVQDRRIRNDSCFGSGDVRAWKSRARDCSDMAVSRAMHGTPKGSETTGSGIRCQARS